MARSGGRRRIRRSAEQWERLIAQYTRSGLSKRGFCEQHGLAPSSLSKALARCPPAGDEGHLPRQIEDFVAVAVDVPQTPSWDVEVQLAPSVFIRLRSC